MVKKKGRTGRRIRIVLVALVALLIAAIVVTAVYAEEIVRRVVERGGSQATQVEVTLDQVQLRGVFGGVVGLRGLRVNNPSGFTTDYLFDLEGVRVSVDPASLRSDPLVIREIIIEGPRVIYEYRDRATNLGRVQRSINAFVGERPDADPDAPVDRGRRMIIEDFQFRDARIAVMAPVLDRDAGVNIPAIRLQNIGKERGGIYADEALAEVYSRLHQRVAGEVAGLGLGEISAYARQARQQAEGAVRDLREQADRAADDAREEADEQVDDAVRRLRDRF